MRTVAAAGAGGLAHGHGVDAALRGIEDVERRQSKACHQVHVVGHRMHRVLGMHRERRDRGLHDGAYDRAAAPPLVAPVDVEGVHGDATGLVELRAVGRRRGDRVATAPDLLRHDLAVAHGGGRGDGDGVLLEDALARRRRRRRHAAASHVQRTHAVHREAAGAHRADGDVAVPVGHEPAIVEHVQLIEHHATDGRVIDEQPVVHMVYGNSLRRRHAQRGRDQRQPRGVA
mmetsp:Transcript_93205/g.240868  ORF Transcript_93205/g.240868 Transcript_93205/m.240868 type:complete len:230 (+) Transcript_93205:306-995(+)